MNSLMNCLQGQVVAMESCALSQLLNTSNENEFGFFDFMSAGRERFEALPRNAVALHFVGPLWAEEYAGATKIINSLGPQIKHLILHINSPGGMVSGLWDLCDTIYAQRGQRNVIALCEVLAASAGYAIASQAHTIICGQSDVVGSIGVRAIHFDQSDMMKSAGFKVTELFFGEQKIDGTPFAPLNEQVRARMQAQINQSGEKFLETVARGRGASLDVEAARATQAAIFTGQDAVNAGLADGLASVADFVEAFNALNQKR